jgi:copper(I)-binding protein
VPNQPSGGAYFSIENTGKQNDRLIGVATTVAKSAELHNMAMDGNVMKMREVAAIDIAPAAKVEMRPGNGYHVMLMGLNQPLKRDDKFTLTLTFEKAGKVDVAVQVRDSGTTSAMHQH